MNSEELIARINGATKPLKTKENDADIGYEYSDDIFLLEMPEGGEIRQLRAVGFTGWPHTLKKEPKKPIRFYAKVIAFEDTNSPVRNWQIETDKIVINKHEKLKALNKALDDLL